MGPMAGVECDPKDPLPVWTRRHPGIRRGMSGGVHRAHWQALRAVYM